MKITKKEIKNILGENATTKQVDIVFTLVDFQSKELEKKISTEIQKLEQKKEESLKKIENDFKEKSSEIFDKLLTKTVQSILKKNGIKIETEVEEKEEEGETEIDSTPNTYSSQQIYNNY